MGEHISLISADGHTLGAYRSGPSGASRGGVVVLQEIFGVNQFIRATCDRLAAKGYTALAPALFDRQQPGFESGYSAEEVARGRQFMQALDWDALLLDTAAAVAALKTSGPVAVVGFCLGGSAAYLAACRLEAIDAAVCFYGGQIVRLADQAPRAPVQMHFGESDRSIPIADVETIRSKRPECDIHTYPAGHGFACDQRGSWDAASAALAWERTFAWLDAAFEGGRPG